VYGNFLAQINEITAFMRLIGFSGSKNVHDVPPDYDIM
jgi:hypothetical protein